VQAARPLTGVAPERQGAGVAADPGAPALRVEPPIVSAASGLDGARADVTLADLSGRPGRYAVELQGAGAQTPLRAGVRIDARGRARLRLDLPAAAGRLVVRDARTGALAATAPVVAARPAATPRDALGPPEVRADGGLAEVLVQVGLLRRADARVRSVRLHGVRLSLVPTDGGAPLPVTGHKQGAAWPAGTYRFLIARRLASGLEVPAGGYRLRVTATGPDGIVLRRESGPFTLD
jgi:hypothetical protein